MYLSKIELDPACRQVRAELSNPYQMHRTLSKAFGDGSEDYTEARCLFRIEEGRNGISPCVLVQSLVRPDWNRLTVESRYMAGPPVVKGFVPRLYAGQRLAFRLRANPTVKRNGKRLGLYKEEDQMCWLRRKGQSGGFEVLSVVTRTEKHKANRGSAESDVVFAAVTLDGVLRITDLGAFVRTLESGVGSGKGFGFGLLSVAPV